MHEDSLVERLRQAVEDGALAPEGRLPAERDLARRLAVSRRSLRMALAALEKEGVIWRGVGQGTFVSERRPRAVQRVPPTMQLTNPTEVMEARLALEPRLAALAALRATPAEIAEMRACVGRGAAASGLADFERWDSRLHRLVARAVHNELLLALFDTVNAARDDKLWGRLKAASLTPERIAAYSEEHGRIVAAVAERDTDRAADAMTTHLTTVQRHLLR
jgi:DNA-binding FadR family transcriptional regulator